LQARQGFGVEHALGEHDFAGGQMADLGIAAWPLSGCALEKPLLQTLPEQQGFKPAPRLAAGFEPLPANLALLRLELPLPRRGFVGQRHNFVRADWLRGRWAKEANARNHSASSSTKALNGHLPINCFLVIFSLFHFYQWM